MDIAYSGMTAQSERIKIIAQNIANADTTPTQAGQDPYRRQIISFKSVYDKTVGANVVKVAGVTADQSPFKTKLDPGNPAADANGYIYTPNVNPVIEAADMREAQRSYQASLSAMDLMKSVQMQTINDLK
jgi:flagellar basal-body rod protein FlgC